MFQQPRKPSCKKSRGILAFFPNIPPVLGKSIPKAATTNLSNILSNDREQKYINVSMARMNSSTPRSSELRVADLYYCKTGYSKQSAQYCILVQASHPQNGWLIMLDRYIYIYTYLWGTILLSTEMVHGTHGSRVLILPGINVLLKCPKPFKTRIPQMCMKCFFLIYAFKIFWSFFLMQLHFLR